MNKAGLLAGVSQKERKAKSLEYLTTSERKSAHLLKIILAYKTGAIFSIIPYKVARRYRGHVPRGFCIKNSIKINKY